jgi:TadE-like protein
VRLLRFHRDESAQGVIEFAVLLTALVLMFSGTVDFSRFMYFNTAAADAARVGAEAAIGHCPTATDCGQTYIATYDLVLQSMNCEGTPYVQFQPTLACTPITAAGASPCSGGAAGCPSPCSQDICITPSYTPGTNTLPTTSSPDVTVRVGFDFTPFTPLMNQFFPARHCWTNVTSGTQTITDPLSSNHTICAQSVGRVR